MTTISRLPTLTTITDSSQVLVLAEDLQISPPVTKKVSLTTLFGEAINGIVGPQGDQGIQGLQGPIGPAQGIQGASVQGTQGLQGQAGSMQGLQGALGVQGPAGSMQGLQGLQGVQGRFGNQGVQGQAGSIQGLQGVQGTKGADNFETYANILKFGGVGDGTTDNAQALNDAFASLSNTGGVIYFPPGKYYFDSAITYDFPITTPWSIRILGGGADVTILQWGATDGIILNASSMYHSIHIEDLAFTTTGSNTGRALVLNNSEQLGAVAQNDIVRCTFRGDTGPGGAFSEFWATSVEIAGLSNININGCLFFGYTTNGTNGYGNGIVLAGVPSGGNKYGIVYNINSCGFFWQGIGIQYGTYIQGIQIDQCNFTNGITGIYAPQGETGLDQLSIANSQFNTYGNQIWLRTAVGAVSLTNNLIYVWENTSGLLAELQAGVVAVGNAFINAGSQDTGQNGLVLGPGAAPSVITGNTFEYMTTGVYLQSGCQNVNVQSNSYLGCTNTVVNSGSNNTIGSSGTLPSRTTLTGSTTSIANNSTATITISGYKSYSLLKVSTNAAAWVRLYTTSAARTADASRIRSIDPLPGTGVIVDVITTSSSTVAYTQPITPGVIGFNDDGTPSTNVYAAVTNLSGSTRAITVTLKVVQLEA